MLPGVHLQKSEVSQGSVTTSQQPQSSDHSTCSSEGTLILLHSITSCSPVTSIILTDTYQLDLNISYTESSLNSLKRADKNHLFTFVSGYRNFVQLCCCNVSLPLHKTAHFHFSFKPAISKKKS